MEAVKRDLKQKSDIIYDILVRWWYVMPDWPPKDFDYSLNLKDLGYRIVT